MKFNLKTAIILALIITIVFLMLSKRTSGMDSDKCNAKPIDAKIACITAYPDYPLAGDMIENGAKKYCCKS
jgi:hypothetical protein